jgi:hypothetical protein
MKGGVIKSVWAGSREILHAHARGLIDIRLTRGLIRALNSSLKRYSRVVLRKTPSDWVWIRLSRTRDIPFVLRLLERAAARPIARQSRRGRQSPVHAAPNRAQPHSADKRAPRMD